MKQTEAVLVPQALRRVRGIASACASFIPRTPFPKVCGLLAVSTSVLFSVNAYACWDEVAAKYGLTPDLLYAVASYESGLRNDAVNVNKNGSRDVCMMQVNSSHFPELARYGITESMLKSNACLCLDVGAWILSQMFRQYGNSWTAIGAYNAASADRRRKYAWGIYRELQKLQIARARGQ